MKKLFALFLILPLITIAQDDKKPRDRSEIIFTVEVQEDVEFTPTTGKCGYTLTVKDAKGNLMQNVMVHMVNIKSKTKYKTFTDKDGKAKLWLETGARYEVDLEKKECVDVIEIERIKYGTRSSEIVYKP